MPASDRTGDEAAGPLADVRVIDCSTLIAGPGCARYLGDFGADVIKVEHPDRPDGARTLGWAGPDGESLWWRLIGRNKRCVTADLSSGAGRDALLRLAADAHVVVENFRPGTFERWGLGPDVLHEVNPDLVLTRVTGFGQDGPYAPRPGFATLAEAMSGFAAINGEPDGAPLLPPIALTDEVTALAGAFATMVALHSGRGQVVDVSLLDTMLQLMGALPMAAAVLGYEQPRMGSGIPYTVPRGTYRASDGGWVALSTSSESVAARLLALVGLGGDARLSTSAGRVAHRDEVEAAVAAWVAARPRAEVLRACDEADVAAAPVLTMTEVLNDPHVVARGSVTTLDGTPMQGLLARLSATPGALRWAGRPHGADQAEVLGGGP